MARFPSKEEAREQFWGLREEIDAAEAEIAPLNVSLGKIAEEEEQLRRKRQKVGAAKMKIVQERKLADKKNELAGLARFLGGNTGQPPKKKEAN